MSQGGVLLEFFFVTAADNSSNSSCTYAAISTKQSAEPSFKKKKKKGFGSKFYIVLLDYGAVEDSYVRTTRSGRLTDMSHVNCLTPWPKIPTFHSDPHIETREDKINEPFSVPLDPGVPR